MFPILASWARAGLCGALLAFLAGCGLLPGCGCEEPPKPPPSAEPAQPPQAQPPGQATALPGLPIAPMPPPVTQAPLPPPPSQAAQPALPPVSVAPLPRPTAAAPQPLAGQRFGAQLGAFRTLANASGAWERFKARYIDLLNTVPGPLLREVDLGAKGKFVRVLAGPFGSEPEARSLCIEVLARGGFCYVQPLR